MKNRIINRVTSFRDDINCLSVCQVWYSSPSRPSSVKSFFFLDTLWSSADFSSNAWMISSDNCLPLILAVLRIITPALWVFLCAISHRTDSGIILWGEWDVWICIRETVVLTIEHSIGCITSNKRWRSVAERTPSIVKWSNRWTPMQGHQLRPRRLHKSNSKRCQTSHVFYGQPFPQLKFKFSLVFFMPFIPVADTGFQPENC